MLKSSVRGQESFIFHAVNGLRLMLQQFGFTLGKPTRPIYPYKHALQKARPWTIGMIAVIVIISLAFLFDFVAGGF